MHLNSIRSYPAGYDCPPLPVGLCSHRDLADLVLHYFEFADTAFRPPVSDEGIRRLIELAFFTSMAPEEGRYPRFIILCQRDVGAPFTVTRFDSITMDDVEVLRRVAPSCTRPECALLVTYRDERLWCDGVVNVGPMGYDTMPGRPGFHSGGRGPSIRIDVRGAGHMIAHCGLMAYELRAGKIRYLSDFWEVPGVKAFREEFSQYLEQEIIQREGKDANKFFGGSKGNVPINVILSRMLRIAVDASHGGAFVIIPGDSCDSDSNGIRLKYVATDLDLGLDMIEFYCSCIDAARKCRTDGYDGGAIRRWTHLKARMLIAAETVGNLSCVDGCVVLNRRLQLCGFGGEILVPDEKAQSSPRRFENYMTGEKWDYDSFLEGIGGTRHKSAARLCKAFDGVLAFIVSQDGELKIISSDGEKVNAFGPVDVPFPGDEPPVGMA